MENQSKITTYATPLAIIFAGFLIAGTVVYSVGKNKIANDSAQNAQPEQTGSLEALTPITAQDHILGDPKAPIKIVEFSDTECPFCKKFQTTMHQAVKEYSGKVAWVYRQFPLDQLHSKARKESEATECAGEQGGNTKFWAYLDRLFEITPSNNGLDLAELPNIAEYVGLDRSKFEKCLSSGKFAKHIQDNVNDAIATGGNGTPWSILIAPNGKKYPINGAQPYENIKQIIDATLK